MNSTAKYFKLIITCRALQREFSDDDRAYLYEQLGSLGRYTGNIVVLDRLHFVFDF